MNVVGEFLTASWTRLGLERCGEPGALSYLFLTPRFRASRHVVVLVFASPAPVPVLVAKVPRLADGDAELAREAANLRAVHALRPGGFGSIPRVVAFEPWAGRPLLVETALAGRAMDRGMVRRDPGHACRLLRDWLADVGRPVAQLPAGAEASAALERLVDRPLRRLAELLPLDAEERALLVRTHDLVAPLRLAGWPQVFAHGDLAAPNVLRLARGGAGVVDWELAEPHGLPAGDLFFFLSYVALARARARSVRQEVAAFADAFFGPRAWARGEVLAYAERIGLAEALLTPLFVACWARYAAGLVVRLGTDESGAPSLGPDTVGWWRANRYYALWRYAVDHVAALDWRAPAAAAPWGRAWRMAMPSWVTSK